MSDARVNAGAGRVAVVTGAARGIGQAIALRLAEAGHATALGDVRPARALPAVPVTCLMRARLTTGRCQTGAVSPCLRSYVG